MKPIKDYQYSFNHVRERTKYRHNCTITIDEYDCMNDVIKSYKKHNLKPISTDNNGEQEVYMYTHSLGKQFKVVWSNSRNRITTVLPN